MDTHLKFAKYLAHSLDSKFKIGKFSFGLDPLFDFIPILGGLIPASLSLYIVWIGYQMRLPDDKLSQMIGNIVLDYLLGVVPIVGWAADFVFKSNIKNLEILEKYGSEIYEGQVV